MSLANSLKKPLQGWPGWLLTLIRDRVSGQETLSQPHGSDGSEDLNSQSALYML